MKPKPVTRTRREPLFGGAAIMTMAFRGADLAPLGERLIARAAADAGDADALMDLAVVLQLRERRDLALAAQAQALRLRQLYHLPAKTGATPLRLLALMAPGDLTANGPLDFLLTDADVSLDMLYVLPGMPFPPLPEHDLAIIAVCESDANRALLQQLAALAPGWPHPVLNSPDRVGRTRREDTHMRLRGVAGIQVPRAARLAHQALRELGGGAAALNELLEGAHYPVIIRPVDAHGGHGLARIDAADWLEDYLLAMPDAEFILAQFVDYRSADGLYRKYRIALIDGAPYAVHMGISDHWMIHYLNAGMSESAAKRAEEAGFMARFDDDFARRHADALRAIHARLELDYVVIDCGETRDGKLLVFELDTGAVVHAMDPADLFPYKHPQMQKVFEAFRAMLARKARGGAKP